MMFRGVDVFDEDDLKFQNDSIQAAIVHRQQVRGEVLT